MSNKQATQRLQRQKLFHAPVSAAESFARGDTPLRCDVTCRILLRAALAQYICSALKNAHNFCNSRRIFNLFWDFSFSCLFLFC